MESFTEQHKREGDFDHPCNLLTLQHSLRYRNEPCASNTDMPYDAALAEFRSYAPTAPVPPELFQFRNLQWNSIHWPENNVSVLFGNCRESMSRDISIESAEGTIVAWDGNVHYAGLDDSGRIMATRYAAERSVDGDTRYNLMRADAGVTREELRLDDASFRKLLREEYAYLDHSESFVHRFVINPAPSQFDGETGRPFATAGLVTQGMVDAFIKKGGYDPDTARTFLLTFLHQGGANHLNWHLRSLTKNGALEIKKPFFGRKATIRIGSDIHELPLVLK